MITKEQTLIARVLRQEAEDVKYFKPSLQRGARAGIDHMVLRFLEVFNQPNSGFDRFEFFAACQPRQHQEQA